MNHVLIAALFSSLPACAAMAEGPVPLDLIGIRPVSARPSSVSKIAFTTERGPAAKPPDTLQNLTEDQLQALADFLVPDKNIPPRNFDNALLHRLAQALSAVDMRYKRPIPKAEWDRLIAEMRETFTARNGRPETALLSAEQWEQSINDMLRGFIKKLDDPYALFMDRRETKYFKRLFDRKGFTGIGVSFVKVAEGVKISSILPGSPAGKAGFTLGDVITAIDGVPTKDQSLDTIAERLQEPVGFPVTIRIERLGSPVLMTRAAIRMPDTFSKITATGIGYVYFSVFSDNIDRLIFNEIDKLCDMGATKLIIDVRANSGGMLTMADSIASEFLNDGDVIESTKRQDRLSSRARTRGRGRYFGMPLAIIINGDSASASEALAAALQHHKKAIVVGSQSYGKASFQMPLPIVVPESDAQNAAVMDYRKDGTMLMFTEGGWYPPDERSIEGVFDPAAGRNIPGSGGIVPDQIVELSQEDDEKIMTGLRTQLSTQIPSQVVDLQLDRAIEVLQRP